jgi:DNA-binding winged helix-turn-helix (wHTH) protein
MLQQLFFVNDFFAVDPQLGTVKDTRTGQETRLEPRIMHLFCLLAAAEGKLVTREYLVKTVWDDYGSADEGLTQAISYLRKVFNDQEKTLIETVPKKGYVLHTAISAATIVNTVSEIGSRRKIKPLYWAITTAVLLLLLAYFFFIRTNRAFAPDVVGGSAPADRHDTSSPDVVKNPARMDHHDTSSKKSTDLK